MPRTFLKIRTSVCRVNNVILPVSTRVTPLHATFLMASFPRNHTYEKRLLMLVERTTW